MTNPTINRRANSHFRKGSGLFTCKACKRQTRHTGGDGADLRLCDICYDLAGEENHFSDTGAFYSTPDQVLAMVDALKEKKADVTGWAEVYLNAVKLKFAVAI